MLKTEKKFSILVVEDNKSLLENLRILLEFNSFNVITAENGIDALNTLQNLQRTNILPDLILSDILMPKMDGYDFFRLISNYEMWNKIPFIFLSALTYPEHINLAKSLGVDDYITKPFIEEELLSCINLKLKKSKRTYTNNSFMIFQKVKDSQNILFYSIKKNDELKIETIYPKTKETKIFINLIQSKLVEYQKDESSLKRNEFNQEFLFTNIGKTKFQGCFLINKNISIDNNTKFILGFISDNLSYFDSLNIKKILKEILNYINFGKKWDEKLFWERIIDSLRIKSEGFENALLDRISSISVIK